MRTMINIEDDVLRRAKAVAAKSRTPFREVVNEALRAGPTSVEGPSRRRSCRTQSHKMGLRSGRNLDNIQELLAQVEGEAFR